MSPAASAFHFLVVDEDGVGRPEVASVDGGRRRTLSLLRTASWGSQEAAFSPDGRWIAYDRAWSLIVMKVEGTPGRAIARDASAFSWSPDSRRLVYTEPKAGILVVQRDGTHARRLQPPSRYGDSDPEWSPRGRTIAVIRSTGPEGDMGNPAPACVLLIRADGTHPTVLECAGHSPRQLAWSPDGRKIAVSDNYEGNDITILRLDGLRTRSISHPGDFVTAMAWSPNSRLLAIKYDWVSASPPKYPGLSIIDTIGRKRTISDSFGPTQASSAPAWSLDGRRVAVGACGGNAGRCFIYVMRSDGGGLQQVARIDGRKGLWPRKMIVVWR